MSLNTSVFFSKKTTKSGICNILTDKSTMTGCNLNEIVKCDKLSHFMKVILGRPKFIFDAFVTRCKKETVQDSDNQIKFF